jgi:hypothetical protein
MHEAPIEDGYWGAFASYPPADDYLLAVFPTAEEAKKEQDRRGEEMTEDDVVEGLAYFAAWVHPELAVAARRSFMRGEEAVPCFHYPWTYMALAGY